MVKSPASAAWMAAVRPAIYGDSDTPVVVLDDPVARLLKAALDAVSAFRGLQTVSPLAVADPLEHELARSTAAFTEALAEVRAALKPGPMAEDTEDAWDAPDTESCAVCKIQVEFNINMATRLRTCPACGAKRPPRLDPTKPDAVNAMRAAIAMMPDEPAFDCRWCGETHAGGPENCEPVELPTKSAGRDAAEAQAFGVVTQTLHEAIQERAKAVVSLQGDLFG